MSLCEQQSALATGIRLDLEATATRMYAQSTPLPWVAMYICQEAVQQVLIGAREVLRELQLEDAELMKIPPEELSPLWVKYLTANQNASWRAAPQVVELQYLTIQDVAAAVYAAVRQGAWNRHFLQYGPAPGVPEYPALASLEKSKSLPMPFVFTGNPATVLCERYRAYSSHTAARRRIPGPRATSCVLPSDTTHPALYAPVLRQR
jgi:hypothetical protein